MGEFGRGRHCVVRQEQAIGVDRGADCAEPSPGVGVVGRARIDPFLGQVEIVPAGPRREGSDGAGHVGRTPASGVASVTGAPQNRVNCPSSLGHGTRAVGPAARAHRRAGAALPPAARTSPTADRRPRAVRRRRRLAARTAAPTPTRTASGLRGPCAAGSARRGRTARRC